MTTESIPMGEAFSWGWIKFKENAPFLVVVYFVAIGVPYFVRHFGMSMARNGLMEFIINVVVFVVSTTAELGIIKIALRILDGRPVEFANLFDSFDKVGWYAVARFLMTVAVFLGILLLVVPGIVVSLRLWFIGYITIDENPVGLDSLQRSIDVTRGFTVDLFLFLLMLIGINIVGFICLGVGTLVSLPVSTLATAYIFRHLTARPATATAPTPPPAAPTAG